MDNLINLELEGEEFYKFRIRLRRLLYLFATNTSDEIYTLLNEILNEGGSIFCFKSALSPRTILILETLGIILITKPENLKIISLAQGNNLADLQYFLKLSKPLQETYSKYASFIVLDDKNNILGDMKVFLRLKKIVYICEHFNNKNQVDVEVMNEYIRQGIVNPYTFKLTTSFNDFITFVNLLLNDNSHIELSGLLEAIANQRDCKEYTEQ